MQHFERCIWNAIVESVEKNKSGLLEFIILNEYPILYVGRKKNMSRVL